MYSGFVCHLSRKSPPLSISATGAGAWISVSLWYLFVELFPPFVHIAVNSQTNGDDMHDDKIHSLVTEKG